MDGAHVVGSCLADLIRGLENLFVSLRTRTVGYLWTLRACCILLYEGLLRDSEGNFDRDSEGNFDRDSERDFDEGLLGDSDEDFDSIVVQSHH